MIQKVMGDPPSFDFGLASMWLAFAQATAWQVSDESVLLTTW